MLCYALKLNQLFIRRITNSRLHFDHIKTIICASSGISIPVQVSGTGKIESENSGYMDLTYSGEIDIIPNLPIPLPFSTICHIVLSK